MVRIRLTRVGSKKQPSYRIVVIDRKKPRDSRYIENIGYYNPRTQPETVVVKEDRALYWLNVGAQPSDPVKQMFTKRGTMERFQRYKNGEALDTLLEEAQSVNEEAQAISRKTQYPAPQKSKSNLDDAVDAAVAEVTVEETDTDETPAEADAEATE